MSVLCLKSCEACLVPLEMNRDELSRWGPEDIIRNTVHRGLRT